MDFSPGQKVKITWLAPSTNPQYMCLLGAEATVIGSLDWKEELYYRMYAGDHGARLYRISIETGKYAGKGVVAFSSELSPLTPPDQLTITCEDILNIPKEQLQEADAPLPELA